MISEFLPFSSAIRFDDDGSRAIYLCRRARPTLAPHRPDIVDNRRQRLLLIEEEPVLRDVTAFRLELLGYEVLQCDTAEAGLAQLQERLPDVILVGHALPGVEGPDLIDRLSNDVRTAEIPVMFLSPHSDLDDVQRAFNAGADEYLVTPYDPLVLEHKVERLAQAATVRTDEE